MSLAVAAATAAAGLIGKGLGAIFGRKAEKRQISENDRVYERAKKDELEFWNMQNSYNSPQAQMARLQEAGLNPNLVYGQGAVANSTSAPSTPHAQPFKANAPNMDIPNIVDTYFNITTRQMMLDNMKKQGDNLVLDGAIKAAQAQDLTIKNNFFNDTLPTRKDLLTNQSNLLFEGVIAKALANAFNSGYDSPNLGFGGFTKESAYSKQLKGLGLINELRELEAKGKITSNDINTIRKQFTKRTMSGKFEDMSAKDIIMSLLQGAQLFK